MNYGRLLATVRRGLARAGLNAENRKPGGRTASGVWHGGGRKVRGGNDGFPGGRGPGRSVPHHGESANGSLNHYLFPVSWLSASDLFSF